MNIIETFNTAFIALTANKVRSILTMLGVIIGVTAVILLISIGRGVQNYITDQFEALGSNLIIVQPGKAGFGRDPAESLSNNKLEEKNVRTIERYAGPFITEITETVQAGTSALYKTKSYYVSIYGLNEVGFDIYNFEIDKGRYFTKSEVRAKSKVTIIGPKVVAELFGSQNPIGQRIKLNDESYEVIGTTKSKGQGFDEGAVIPYTAGLETFNQNNIGGIVMKAKDADNIDTAMRQVKRALLRDLKEDEFTVLSQEDILSSIQDILGMLTLGLGAIAAISLIVGGIGIMNIMLVSVTERTREIGLRKALGATPNEVALQFLVESMLLSIAGGLIGITLGWLGSLAMRGFLRTEVPWWAVLLAFSFSAIVGIIFGTYPAVQASRKDPIEALRYE
jgi:putative ABC transport system permease protein